MYRYGLVSYGLYICGGQASAALPNEAVMRCHFVAIEVFFLQYGSMQV